MGRTSQRVLSCGVAVVALAHAGAATAQSGAAPDSVALEEVVVTAQHRSERLQDVAVSVSAFGADQLQKADILTLDKIGSRTPNLYVVDRGAQNNNSFSVRGINAINNAPTIDPAIGIYLDGVYLGRNTFFSQSLYDVERVEVLRGPQGALYGRNALGGAVNVITRKASSPDRMIDASAAEYDRLTLTGAVGGDITETFSARVAATFNKRDGYVDDTFAGEQVGDQEFKAGRLSLQFRPNPQLTFDLAADMSLATGSDASIEDAIGAGTGGAVPVALAFGYQPGDPFDRKVSYDSRPSDRLENTGMTLTTSYEASTGISLTSITGWRRFEEEYFSDADRLPYAIFNSAYQNRSKQFSQEVRIATPSERRLSILAGAYYFRENLRDEASIIIGNDLKALFGVPALLPQVASYEADARARSYAVYGEGRFRATESVSVVVGGRYTHEKKTLDFAQASSPPIAAALLPPVPAFQRNYDEGRFTPSASVEWKPAGNVLAFAKVSTGFKSGGFNARFPGPQEDVAFDAERLTSYELGIKSDLLDRRLRLNGSLFHIDHRDKQVQTFDGVRNRTDNAAKVKTDGFEVELEAAPARGLTLTGGVGYVDAKYKTYVGPGGVDFSGLKVDNTPDWTINAAAEYAVELPMLGTTTARVEYNHVGEVFYTVNNDPELRTGGYDLVNLRLTVEPREGLSVSAFATNLTDEEYVAFGFDQSASTGLKHLSLGAPRVFGVAARVGF